jgi:hypothetical protein
MGLAFFAQWKLSSDGLGATGPTNRTLNWHQVFGLGPEVSVAMTRGSKLLLGYLNLRYLRDFGAQSMTEGDTFVLTATFPFGQ